jgi:hypothetical protein
VALILPMFRHRTFLSLFALVAAAAVLARAEDDIQVIPAKRSTLSIYSYGGTGRSKVAPEYWDGARRNRRTGALTDVVSHPALATSPQVREPAKTPPSDLTPKPATGSPTKAAGSVTLNSPAVSNTSGSTFSSHAETAPPPVAPGPQTVTVAWDPSPDEAVVGYQLYRGNRSGHYIIKTPLGNQTSAQMVISDSAVYVAVTAYTSEGLESVLSNEVVVSGDGDVTIPSGGGTGTMRSGSQ